MRVNRSAAATTVIATTPASSPRRARGAPGSARSGRGTPGGDVQAHVVDLRRHQLRDPVDVRRAQLLREPLEVVTQADRGDLVFGPPRTHGPRLEPRAHVDEARADEPLMRLLIGREVPR